MQKTSAHTPEAGVGQTSIDSISKNGENVNIRKSLHNQGGQSGDGSLIENNLAKRSTAFDLRSQKRCRFILYQPKTLCSSSNVFSKSAFATKTEMSTSEVVIILMSAFALAMALNTLQATPGQPRMPSPNTEILQ